jgi:quinol monooxygenase YgiN
MDARRSLTVDQIQYVVEFAIKPGRLDEFKRVAREVIDRVHAEEPGTRSYQWYLSANATRCHVHQWYADSAAFVAHAGGDVLADLLPKLLEVSTMSEITFFGDPSPEATRVLDRLARVTTVSKSEWFAGFTREPSAVTR